jgi:hypothetical protein
VAIARIAELKHLAALPESGAVAQIVRVAAQFEERIAPNENGNCASPKVVLRAMRAATDEVTRPIVEALAVAVYPTRSARIVA